MKNFLKMTLATLTGLLLFAFVSIFLTFAVVGAIASTGESKPVMPAKAMLTIDMSTIMLIRLFANLRQNRDTISLMSHEQYTYEDYFNYIPDHLDRVELACRLATEHGYKPVWFPEGILGNNAWEK